ncbi:transposase [Candidatus Neptunichlamydia sp. REUL1]|uniref:transposase n=1 Tax=Candidatus Neptunichlamydia sp. REUL1 TaxID=3064277 RepID=UPI00292EC851|nr:transposase [Candidatus Neptunochlamydia sp. REUL1]
MKKFDKEFKANAVRLVREERMKIKDVAHDLGIGKSTLSYWLYLLQNWGKTTFYIFST